MFKYISSPAQMLSILTLSLFILILVSCKKGEEDPFLSLKTRNSRITGTWTLKSLEQESNMFERLTFTNEVNNDVQIVETDMSSSSTFDGTTLTTLSAEGFLQEDDIKAWDAGNTVWNDYYYKKDGITNKTITKSYEQNFTFYKDNTFIRTTSYTDDQVMEKTSYTEEILDDRAGAEDLNTNVTIDSSYTVANSNNETEEGLWFWEENTQKKRLFINIGEHEVCQVVRLTNKELILECDYYGPYGTITTTESDMEKDTEFITSFTAQDNTPNYVTGVGYQKREMRTSYPFHRLVFEKTDNTSKK